MAVNDYRQSFEDNSEQETQARRRQFGFRDTSGIQPTIAQSNPLTPPEVIRGQGPASGAQRQINANTPTSLGSTWSNVGNQPAAQSSGSRAQRRSLFGRGSGDQGQGGNAPVYNIDFGNDQVGNVSVSGPVAGAGAMQDASTNIDASSRTIGSTMRQSASGGRGGTSTGGGAAGGRGGSNTGSQGDINLAGADLSSGRRGSMFQQATGRKNASGGATTVGSGNVASNVKGFGNNVSTARDTNTFNAPSTSTTSNVTNNNPQPAAAPASPAAQAAVSTAQAATQPAAKPAKASASRSTTKRSGAPAKAEPAKEEPAKAAPAKAESAPKAKETPEKKTTPRTPAKPKPAPTRKSGAKKDEAPKA